ncbi:MAG: DUF4105 domain-containing protein [Elusimicrobia bacterium]|nr:DUF4105 domain-containing protein [Elusimicrobiota bacterium]
MARCSLIAFLLGLFPAGSLAQTRVAVGPLPSLTPAAYGLGAAPGAPVVALTSPARAALPSVLPALAAPAPFASPIVPIPARAAAAPAHARTAALPALQALGQELRQRPADSGRPLDDVFDRNPRHASSAVAVPVDPYEPHPVMPKGRFKGRPIQTHERRALTILEGADAARFAPKEGEVVAANFSHAGKFWIAKFPKDAVEKLIFQKWDFGEKHIRLRLFGWTLLDFKLFHLAHTELRFKLKPGTDIPLYPQERAENPVPAHRVDDIVSSVEGVGPRESQFGIAAGLFNHLVAVRRFKSLQQSYDERVSGEGHVIEQWDLDLPPEKKQGIFSAALVDSHEDAMRTPYHIFLHSCTTEAFRIIDQAMDYGRRAWQSVIFRHIPLFPEAYLWARGLLKPGGKSRLPTLNAEFKAKNLISGYVIK